MRRILCGVTTSLAIWLGSALAAEAQQIEPIGPTALSVGQTAADFSGAVYLPTPSAYRVRIWFQEGPSQSEATTQMFYIEKAVGNPGTQNSTYTLLNCCLNPSATAGYWVKVSSSLKTSSMTDWSTPIVKWIQVPPSRPPLGSTIKKSSTLGVPAKPVLRAVERDGRREE